MQKSHIVKIGRYYMSQSPEKWRSVFLHAQQEFTNITIYNYMLTKDTLKG